MKKLAGTVIISAILFFSCGKKIIPGTETNSPVKNSKDKTEKTTTQTTDQNNSPTSTPSFNTTQQTVPAPFENQRTVSVEKGKKVYVAKCGSCHALKNPGDYTEGQMYSILQVEIPKANLDKTEADQVTAYLISNTRK